MLSVERITIHPEQPGIRENDPQILLNLLSTSSHQSHGRLRSTIRTNLRKRLVVITLVAANFFTALMIHQAQTTGIAINRILILDTERLEHILDDSERELPVLFSEGRSVEPQRVPL